MKTVPGFDYLHDLLSDKNQQQITDALQTYQKITRNELEHFNDAVKHELAEKQKQYDAYMDNLASGALPRDILADIGKKIQALKDEMAALEETPLPHDFTADQIKAWLRALKAAPDAKAIHLLIDRIDVYTKTDIRVFSTLTSVLGGMNFTMLMVLTC